MTRLLWCLLLEGTWLAALSPTKSLPTASLYLTHCHSERNKMKPRLNGRAGKESQSKNIFTEQQ